MTVAPTAGAENLGVLSRAQFAPPPRTLIDILATTARRHPDAVALDSVDGVLTYTQMLDALQARAARLATLGVGRGDRVGIRLPTGGAELHLWILAALALGAAYVPVDFDDPPDRAAQIYASAEVAVVVDDGPVLHRRGPARPPASQPAGPTPADDAWIIFTSGSTGTPKGVAVTHRSAAALVDAEARLFLRETGVAPLGPGDRVLAGLSVAFDASCEEMWLAWRNGAALVPAPRAVVRSGPDFCSWLVDRRITVVSTVPTLAAGWPAAALPTLRLLIFGGEACPAELVDRLSRPGCEIWNTYGPTETTVVACGTRLRPGDPVTIGLPLDGWDLAVVDADGRRTAAGESGELVVGGVGLARYLDPDLDASRFAGLPGLGWTRGYRTGDVVRLAAGGLEYLGRTDDQVKIGGRRIELGEVDAALRSLSGVSAAAAAVRYSAAGTAILVGYVVTARPDRNLVFDRTAAITELRRLLPAGVTPMLIPIPELPVRSSGKVDRAALPWPPPESPGRPDQDESSGSGGRAHPALSGSVATDLERWVAGRWRHVLGVGPAGIDDDFFRAGGSSLTAAVFASKLRERFPRVTVADVYRVSTLRGLVEMLSATTSTVDPGPADAVSSARSAAPRRAGLVQCLATGPLAVVTAMKWLVCAFAVNNLLSVHSGHGPLAWAPTISWWWVAAGAVLFCTPVGGFGVTAVVARLLLRGLQPGDYPRGGAVHLRIWFAERFAEAMGAGSLIGAPLVAWYARALGARIGPDTDLHSMPPITGMLTLGRGAAVNSEVDLSGHWLDGDVLHVGRITVGAGAAIGARTILLPGAVVGPDARVAAGSAVLGRVPARETWAGSPAVRTTTAAPEWPAQRPARARRWEVAFAVGALLIAALPLIAAIPAAMLLLPRLAAAASTTAAVRVLAVAAAPLTVLSLLTYLLLTALAVRLLGVGMVAGHHPVRSRIGWQVWCTEKLMDAARTVAYPIYSSLLTPGWLRLLGAKVGAGVEASTVLLLPSLTTIGSGAFLADDTLVGSYELAAGRLRIQQSKVGKRAFLGNSGMTAPGHAVPKRGLVAVLSSSPAKARRGTSWLGSPPTQLRRSATVADDRRTFSPSRRLRICRALVESCRVVPAVCSVSLGIAVVVGIDVLLTRLPLAVAALFSGGVLLAAGLLAALCSIAAKWLLVGRLRGGDRPLWHSFVWRNELADMFVEMVAAPWLPRSAAGSPLMVWWQRGLGASIGRGVWLETYWLPEADLVTIGAGAAVNRGCVLQTHLFHDRVLSMAPVVIAAGATVGPHGIVLPAACLQARSTVGPASLVLRGESVPAGSRWTGNPIAPWPVPVPVSASVSASASVPASVPASAPAEVSVPASAAVPIVAGDPLPHQTAAA